MGKSVVIRPDLLGSQPSRGRLMIANKMPTDCKQIAWTSVFFPNSSDLITPSTLD